MTDYNIKKVVISASHNIDKSCEQANERILKKAKEDDAAGKACISYNFRRAKDAKIDENKTLMPIFGLVPILAHKIIHRIEQGLEVVVIGSREVGTLVDGLATFLEVSSDQLRYVQELPSLGQNISLGAKTLNLIDNESFCFESADTPLSYDITTVLKDPDAATNIVVADLNARQRIFNTTPEFFPRNYYWEFTNNNSETFEAKEPNIWTFSVDFPFEIIDNFYNTRQGGKLGIGTIMQMFGWKFISNLPNYSAHSYKDFAQGAWRQVNRAIGRKLPLCFHEHTVTDLSCAILGKPVKFKAEHTDPFRLKDIDAWHDLWFYQHVIRQAEHNYNGRGLEHIIPHSSKIRAFNEYIKRTRLNEKIGVLENFKSYANMRASELGMHAPYSRKDEFVAPSAHGERIDQAVEYLVNQKKILKSSAQRV